MEKNCNNCKYDVLLESDFPCSICKFAKKPTHEQDDYRNAPLLWEAIEGEEINHPPRYNHGNYECIDVMVDVFGKEATQHFCLLSSFKYIWRKDYKGGIQDIKKAMWYMDKYLELEGEQHD